MVYLSPFFSARLGINYTHTVVHLAPPPPSDSCHLTKLKSEVAQPLPPLPQPLVSNPNLTFHLCGLDHSRSLM